MATQLQDAWIKRFSELLKDDFERFEPIQIIGGSEVTKENGTTRVPKRDLVSVVQVALQNKTLKIAPSLPDAETLIRELGNFKVKITDTAHDSYGAWREGTHDDLVLAVALALWASTKLIVPTFYSCNPPDSFVLNS